MMCESERIILLGDIELFLCGGVFFSVMDFIWFYVLSHHYVYVLHYLTHSSPGP